MAKPLRIAVTCGEPAGIGAEAVWKALNLDPAPGSEIILVGPESVWQTAFLVADQPLGLNPKIIAPPGFRDLTWEWGKLAEAPARAALASVKMAAELAISGEVDALVTAPLTKEGLALAGCDAPGHTELLGEMCGGKPHMLFTAQGMKVILVTIHLPLAKVCENVTRDKVLDTLRAAHKSLVADFGIPNPKLGVAGLNPHAGEHGKIGGEEIAAIIPAIEAAKAEGIDAVGPVPADALFARGDFDLFVAMYHDQGLGPFKALHFHDGVNVTVGLPIVRTSPDHGTAFDIAGMGEANPESTAEAINTAAFIATRRGALR